MSMSNSLSSLHDIPPLPIRKSFTRSTSQERQSAESGLSDPLAGGALPEIHSHRSSSSNTTTPRKTPKKNKKKPLPPSSRDIDVDSVVCCKACHHNYCRIYIRSITETRKNKEDDVQRHVVVRRVCCGFTDVKEKILGGVWHREEQESNTECCMCARTKTIEETPQFVLFPSDVLLLIFEFTVDCARHLGKVLSKEAWERVNRKDLLVLQKVTSVCRAWYHSVLRIKCLTPINVFDVPMLCMHSTRFNTNKQQAQKIVKNNSRFNVVSYVMLDFMKSGDMLSLLEALVASGNTCVEGVSVQSVRYASSSLNRDKDGPVGYLNNGLATMLEACGEYLRILNAYETKNALTDDGMVRIARSCKYLESLDVRYSDGLITDASLLAIAENCPHFKTLAIPIDYGSVTDSGLKAIGTQCKGFERLTLLVQHATSPKAVSIECLLHFLLSCPMKVIDIADCDFLQTDSVQLMFSLCGKLELLNVQGIQCVTKTMAEQLIESIQVEQHEFVLQMTLNHRLTVYRKGGKK
eukprot:PhF_6_TR21030/c0_g1_i1/m.30242